MLTSFRWDVLPADPTRATALARRCGVDPLIAQLLLNRGVSQPSDAKQFFAPTPEALEDPLKLPDMANAVSRVRNAIAAKERILVFGDADVDGITASVIVYELLTSLARPGKSGRRACPDLSHTPVGAGGARVSVRLSNRLKDGYGFPNVLIKRLIRFGVRLLILVDCGTNQQEEIRALGSYGIDTIVLDHHVPTEPMAQPLALVNPYLGDRVGLGLSSAGLALKLAQALCPDNAALLHRCLDLAALGTLADYAPLIGDNRIIVAAGVSQLLTTHRPGLRQLCQAVELTMPTPEQILRRLVPCLNAAGRLGDPRSVFTLLVEPSAHVGQRLVEVLKQAHAKTKALHRQIQAEAHEQVSRIHFKDQYVVVIGRYGWHPGLMGPLASQLVERYARPAIAIALGGRIGVGSGRSIAEFNLLEALRVCQGMLLRYGGHPAACGLTISSGNVGPFREQINRHAQGSLGRQNLVRTLAIDLEVALDEVTSSAASAIERLAPFGPGNPRPLMLFRKLTIERDADDRAWVTDGRTRIRVRGRRVGLLPSERYDVVVSPWLAGDGLALSICDARLHFASQNV